MTSEFNPSVQPVQTVLARVRLLAAARSMAGILIFSRVLVEFNYQQVSIGLNPKLLAASSYAFVCSLIWALLHSTPLRRWERVRFYVFALMLCDVGAYTLPALTRWYPTEDWLLVFGFTTLTAGLFLQRSQALAFMSGACLMIVTEPMLQDHSVDVNRLYISVYIAIGLFLVTWAVSELNQLVTQAERDSRLSRQKALRLQETNALALRALPVGVLVMNERDEVEQLNPAAQRLLFPSGEVPGTTPRGFGVLELPGGEQVRNWLRATNHWGAPRSDLKVDLVDGRRLLFSLYHDHVLFDAPVNLVFVEDRAELLRRIHEQKLASMGRLAASVAHEIRNPLAAISQAAELLGESPRLDAQQTRLLELIRINCRRIDHTVADVLDLGSSAAVEPELIRVKDAVEEVMQSLGLDASRVWLDLPDVELRVRFVPMHFNRVLVNLLSNADRHATRAPHAVRVAFQLAKATPGLTVPLAERMLVENDGAPIAMQVLSRLFEPFNTSRTDGSGLGLYICTELCQRNGARIAYSPTSASQGVRPSRDNSVNYTNHFTVVFAEAATAPATLLVPQPLNEGLPGMTPLSPNPSAMDATPPLASAA